MSIKFGKYYICDRCGTTSFCEKIGEEETDGGFTRFNKFEEAEGWTTVYPEASHGAEGWITVYPEVSHGMGSSKLLCPACSEKYDKLMCEFFDTDRREFDHYHQ